MTAARGYSSASAREAALKLVETSYVSAHGMSSADLLHGPVALLDQSVPLLCFTSEGPDAPEMQDLVTLAARRGVDVDVIGDGTVAGRTLPAVLPRGVAPQCGRCWRSSRRSCSPPTSPWRAATTRTRRAV